WPVAVCINRGAVHNVHETSKEAKQLDNTRERHEEIESKVSSS
uniref:Uncharacterized protein n=1 Tax=Aegilops tauschii subsp. strangulata TaxID=200361 RepID=A0A453D737_AEGTS